MEELTSKQRDDLVVDNTKLVTYTITKNFKRFVNTDYFEDLKQEGYIGLIKAARDFDPSLGFKFSTYASCKIYGEAQRFVRDKVRGCGIKLSRGMLDMQGRIIELTRNGDISFSTAELADILCEDESRVINCIQSMKSLTSIDQPISEESDDTLAAFLEYTEDGYNDIEYTEFIENIEKFILEHYSGRQKDIIEDYFYNYLFFGELFTQTELANRYKISQAQVCRMLIKFKADAAKSGILNI